MPVIASTLDRIRLYVKAHRTSARVSTVITHHPFNLRAEFDIHGPIRFKNGPLDYVRAVVQVFKERRYPIDNLEIEIKSSLLPGAGLASSAALSVLIAAALNHLFALNLTMDKICSLAHMAESRNLATGVGQMDHFVTGLGGVLLIDCSTEPARVKRLIPRKDIAIITGSTGRLRNIRQVQNLMAQRMATKEPGIARFIESTQDVLSRMTDLLSMSDWSPRQLGSYITECHVYLRDYARVSNEPIERFIRVALSAGAFGAKLTGATGEGGSMFAISDFETSSRVVETITNAGGHAHISIMNENGLLLENAERFESV